MLHSIGPPPIATAPQAHVGITSSPVSSSLARVSSAVPVSPWVPIVSPRVDSRCINGRPPPTANLSSNLHGQPMHTVFQRSSSEKSLPNLDLFSHGSLLPPSVLAPRRQTVQRSASTDAIRHSVQRSTSSDSLPAVGSPKDVPVVRFISAKRADAPNFMIATHARSSEDSPSRFLKASVHSQHSSARFCQPGPSRGASASPSSSARVTSSSPRQATVLSISYGCEPTECLRSSSRLVLPARQSMVTTVSESPPRIVSPARQIATTSASELMRSALGPLSGDVVPASPLQSRSDQGTKGSSARFAERSGRPPPSSKKSSVGKRSCSAERLSYSDSAGAIGRMFRAATATCAAREEFQLRPEFYSSAGLSRSNSVSSVHSEARRSTAEQMDSMVQNAQPQVPRTPSCSSTVGQVLTSNVSATVVQNLIPSRRSSAESATMVQNLIPSRRSSAFSMAEGSDTPSCSSTSGQRVRSSSPCAVVRTVLSPAGSSAPVVYREVGLIAGSASSAIVQGLSSPGLSQLVSPTSSQRSDTRNSSSERHGPALRVNAINSSANIPDTIDESLNAESLVGDWMPYPQRLRSQGSLRSETTDDTGKHASAGCAESVENSRMSRDSERFEVLYKDNEMRQRRWLARYCEKLQKEDDDVKQLFDHSKTNRPYDRKNFNNWYSNNTNRYFQADAARREQHVSQEEKRLNQELAECQAPQIAAKKSVRAGKSKNHHQKRQVVEELIAAQAVAAEALVALDERSQAERASREKQSAEDLKTALEDNQRRIERFVKTDDGREMMAERAFKYKELNEGLDDASALKEAQEDLMRASEEKVRADTALAFRGQTRNDEHRIQLERLQVLRELIHLQKQYEDIISDETATWLQSFDPDLVSRIKQEAWYREARDAAERLVRAEAEIAAEKAATENARPKPQQQAKIFRI